MFKTNTYTLLKRGQSHPSCCEDALWAAEWQGLCVGAVSDGCSSGVRSHFASALTIKILQMALKKQAISHDKENLAYLGAKWIADFYEGMAAASAFLELEQQELLATLMVAIMNPQTQKAWILALGDGLWAVNEQIEEINQDNQPHYPIYDLENPHFQAYEWALSNGKNLTEVQNLAISTDGVASFLSATNTNVTSLEPISYMLTDSHLAHLNQMLQRKYNILNTQHKLSAFDDVGIVRFMLQKY